MKKPRVLYVCHNHPAIRPGGAETYGLELYEAMLAAGGYEPILLARTGPPLADGSAPPVDGLIGAMGTDSNQYLLHTDGAGFDRLMGVQRVGSSVADAFRRFLLDVRPDVVHFQHTLYLGYDLIPLTRRTLAGVPILYTLHDYIPICHRWGQMVRADGTLCESASARRCHECFQDVPPALFAARTQSIRAELDAVDLFIAPSALLASRFREWGIPAERILVEEYGRLPMPPASEPEPARERRDRFGFFGQLTEFKGINVLLEAMLLVRGRGVDATLRVHGANLDTTPAGFRNRFHELLALGGNSVAFLGGYTRDDLPHLMADVDWVVVPSLWWENSPLVIQEAFAYGRPMICSNVGGMAEKVADGVDGLHFQVGDPAALADVLERAADEPPLWEALRTGIPPVHAMDGHLHVLHLEYQRLLEEQRKVAA